MTTWRNRIIGSGEGDPKQLLANPSNWRIHPRAQQDALSGVLDEVGWVDQIIVNRTTGHVVDGHLRVSLALRRNEPTVPVLYVDLSEAEEKLVLATLDPIAAMATADREQLDALLRDVQTGDAAVREMLSDLAQQSGLDYARPQLEDVEPQIDRATELRAKWEVEPGQLWQLGEHRLICGDCTDKAVVERVMGGEKAEMVWTDPPYGVSIGDKNKFLNSIDPSNRIDGNLVNDTLDEPQLFAMLCAAFDNVMSVCLAGGAWYVAAPPGLLHILFGQALKERGIWRQTIHWVKNNSTFAPLGMDYRSQAELIFYGWLPGAAHRFYGGRSQTTVWEIDKPMKSPEHPTMKPVELVVRAVENSSRRDDIVIDPFVGSGTTIIACEQLGRCCRGIEISPAYCAVAIQRWVDMTGKEPKLIES